MHYIDMDSRSMPDRNLKYLLGKAEHELENELNKNYFENGEIKVIDPSIFVFFF